MARHVAAQPVREIRRINLRFGPPAHAVGHAERDGAPGGGPVQVPPADLGHKEGVLAAVGPLPSADGRVGVGDEAQGVVQLRVEVVGVLLGVEAAALGGGGGRDAV